MSKHTQETTTQEPPTFSHYGSLTISSTTSTPYSSWFSVSSALHAATLDTSYPVDMVVRNTFLDFESDSLSAAQPAGLRRSRSEPPAHFDTQREEPRKTSIVNIGAGTSKSDVRFTVERPMVSKTVRGPAAPQQLPSPGSAGHGQGTCIPCAFFWKDAGCSNGQNCVFCHLCGPQEKKRRQQQKKKMLKSQAKASIICD
eukprot:TRINITY_DN9479_c0_g1_i2.p1 TRINITY_DN9479_c0_g1~~TRINITY_DN9479_c0_g1_i2.p1  ORF type:complete len:199 (-),score=41.53 TRINITY_DN9479_c0_g1_i2:268-864(-)